MLDAVGFRGGDGRGGPNLSCIQRAEITNVEVLIMRTAMKSKTPAKRIEVILADWSQTWGKDAKGVISAHVAKMVSESAYPAPSAA